ncbi:MAG: BglG family transcription antiterminator [Propioniciclava sp.]
MVTFTERESLLLEVLREAARPVVSADLSDLLGVSPRTLRNDIGRINRLREPVIDSTSAGYHLNAAAYRRVLREAPRVTSVLDDDERLLVYLLQRPERSLYDAANECLLGESAVRAALIRLGARAQEHDLTVTLRGSRIRVAGRESDRRRLLGDLVRDAMNDPVGGAARLQRLLPDVDLERLEQTVDRVVTYPFGGLDDPIRQSLLVHAAISLQRFDDPVEVTVGREPPAAVHHYTDELLAALAQEYPDRPLGADDRAQLLRVVGVSLDAALPVPTPALADEDLVRRAVAAAVDECLAHFDLSAQRDKLVDSVTAHTMRLIARNATLMFFRNGLRESMRTRSPYLYDVAVHLAHHIAASLNVRMNDDEISLFAIYLGLYADHHDTSADAVAVTIVCPAYLTLREWLLSRLLEHFGDRIVICDVVSSLEEAEATDGELVVTTAGATATVLETVEISALCPEHDLEAVGRGVARVAARREQARLAAILARFLDRRVFFVDRGFGTSDEVIDFLCAELEATGRVSEGFSDSVRTRERYSSTAFANRVAVPHPMELLARETTVAVLIPSAPVRWGASEVSMVLMLAVSQGDDADFTSIYEPLIRMLCQPELFAELHRIRDFDAFADLLSQRLVAA